MTQYVAELWSPGGQLYRIIEATTILLDLQEHYLIALAQPKGGATALLRKRMMAEANAATGRTAGPAVAPSSAGNLDAHTAFTQIVSLAPKISDTKYCRIKVMQVSSC